MCPSPVPRPCPARQRPTQPFSFFPTVPPPSPFPPPPGAGPSRPRALSPPPLVASPTWPRSCSPCSPPSPANDQPAHQPHRRALPKQTQTLSQNREVWYVTNTDTCTTRLHPASHTPTHPHQAHPRLPPTPPPSGAARLRQAFTTPPRATPPPPVTPFLYNLRAKKTIIIDSRTHFRSPGLALSHPPGPFPRRRWLSPLSTPQKPPLSRLGLIFHQTLKTYRLRIGSLPVNSQKKNSRARHERDDQCQTPQRPVTWSPPPPLASQTTNTPTLLPVIRPPNARRSHTRSHWTESPQRRKRRRRRHQTTRVRAEESFQADRRKHEWSVEVK